MHTISKSNFFVEFIVAEIPFLHALDHTPNEAEMRN